MTLGEWIPIYLEAYKRDTIRTPGRIFWSGKKYDISLTANGRPLMSMGPPVSHYRIVNQKIFI